MDKDPQQVPAKFRSGFIALVGAPNAGKSTLLNRLLGVKISITSDKPQTTRNRILGIVHRPESQLVFIDTPGLHRARRALNVRIVDAALAALVDVDLVLVIVDALHPDPEAEAFMVRKLAAVRKPQVLALNKIDRLRKPRLLTLIEHWSRAGRFQEVVPIAAKTGEQVDRLMETMISRLPEGPPYFPPDAMTDVPERFIAAEIVREKAFRLTGAEIPYSVAVTIDDFQEDPSTRTVSIHASVHVERDSQKAILIGKGGAKLKRIGEQARKDIQRLLGTRVYLRLFVRVQKNWTRDTRALRKFGY